MTAINHPLRVSNPVDIEYHLLGTTFIYDLRVPCSWDNLKKMDCSTICFEDPFNGTHNSFDGQGVRIEDVTAVLIAEIQRHQATPLSIVMPRLQGNQSLI